MNIYIILLFISFSEQQIIKNGVYNIMNNNNYLQHCKRKILNCGYLKYPNTFFRIIFFIKSFIKLLNYKFN